jgi:hypothetical protein
MTIFMKVTQICTLETTAESSDTLANKTNNKTVIQRLNVNVNTYMGS